MATTPEEWAIAGDALGERFRIGDDVGGWGELTKWITFGISVSY